MKRIERIAHDYVAEVSNDVDERIDSCYGYVHGPDLEDVCDAYEMGIRRGIELCLEVMHKKYTRLPYDVFQAIEQLQRELEGDDE